MPSIGQIASGASLPASIALKLAGLSNPVTAAIGAGLTLVQLVDKIGQGRKAAKKFTSDGGPQDIINKQLAAISGSQASPEEKAQATDQAWKDFLSKSNEFASANPKQATVVKQAIYNTPGLTDTVQSLLGGQNPLDDAYVNEAVHGIDTGMGKPNPGPSVLGTVAKAGIAAASPFVMSKLATGSWNGATTVGRVAAGGGGSAGGTGIDELGNVIAAANPKDVSGSIASKGPGILSKVAGAVFGGGTGGDTANQSLLSRILPSAISSGTSLLSGVLGSRAATKAANVQAGASEAAAGQISAAGTRAAELQAQTARESLQFNREALAQQQANQQPWIDAGSGALRTIGQITSNPGFSWNRTFKAPTAEEAMQDPGIQYQLQQGQRALEAYERANGTLLSGKAVKEINQQAQGIASTGYQNVFNRDLTGYNTDYNTFAQERGAQLNPQLALAGLGQTTVGQVNANIGQAASQNATIAGGAANNIGNIDTSTAASVANQNTNASAARASGYVGSGNSWLNSLGQIGSNLVNTQTIQQLLQRLQPQAA